LQFKKKNAAKNGYHDGFTKDRLKNYSNDCAY